MNESTNEMTVDSTEMLSDHRSYERSIDTGESVCEAIVSAVTTLKNVEMVEIEPLYSAVDGEALERVVSSNPISYISFNYVGYRVEVHGRSRVTLTPTE